MACMSFYFELYMRFCTTPGGDGFENEVGHGDDSTNYSKISS